MGLIETLRDIIEESGNAINDELETVSEFATEVVQSFEGNKEVISRSFQNIAIVDKELLIDLAIELIKATITSGHNVNFRIKEVINMSFELVVEAGDDFIFDFLKTLFENFKNQFEYYQIAIESIFNFLDFKKLFEKALKYASSNFQNYKTILETILTPIFLIGLIILGPDRLAKISKDYLKSNSTTFTQRRNINEVIPAQQEFLTTIRNDSYFDFSTIQYLFAGIFENLRRGSNVYGSNAFLLEIDNTILKSIIEPFNNFFQGIFVSFIRPLVDHVILFFQELIDLVEDDIELEWRILELARFTPLGILFILIAVPYKLLNSPAPFINLLFNPIEDDPNLKTLRLPCPDKENKYIFFSDIHRDAIEDKRPNFQFLSIDHFDPNGTLYLELLEYYDNEGYTIIEVGDCEELWFHRDFSIRPNEKLRSIIQKYQDIYNKLKDMHERGKYFRVYGNHDSYIWEDNQTRSVYFNHFDSVEHPFVVYNFIIIDGVKSMTDVPFYLGLDSHPNEKRKPMIVTHGHQWDFWNCDSNNILGKLIVSAVVTPLDFLDDPFKDIGGISSHGSALVNFKTILADLFIYNNWLSKEPANKLSDSIQHKEDSKRLLIDDIMYSESLASFMGNLIFVRKNNDCAQYETLCEEDYVLFNLLCIGHTHNPQNMPYHELESLPVMGDFIEQFENSLEKLTRGLVPVEGLSLVKSNYINTGTSGWWEKTIWALDLGKVSHYSGQPKLINWSANTKINMPNEMDWELPHLPHNGPNSEGERLEQLHEDIRQWITSLIQDLRTRGEQIVINSPVGSIMDLVQFNNGDENNFELTVPAELHGILDELIGLVGFALNQLAALCKEVINYTIKLRIEMPEHYQKVMNNNSKSFPKTKQNRFIQTVGLMAAKEMISKVQFRDSDRVANSLADTVEDKLNSALFTLAWLFNPKNSYKGQKNNIKLNSDWKMEKNELVIELQFKKKTNSPQKTK